MIPPRNYKTQNYVSNTPSPIYNKYFSNFPIDVTYVLGNVNSEEYKQISEIITPKELLLYDCPDGAIKFSDKTIILEHFQIDTSKFIKNGGTLLNIETKGTPQNCDRAVLLRNVKTKEELRKPEFLDKANKYASYSNLADNFVNSVVIHRLNYNRRILRFCFREFAGSNKGI